MKFEPITIAIKHAGSQMELAKACGVSQATVWKWSEGKKVKADYVLTIAGITKGEVKPYQIRPDLPELFPHPSQEA